MANVSLAELRRNQQIEPPTATPALNPAFDEAEYGLESPQAAVPVHVGPPPSTTRGYVRIFPPTFPTVAQIPDDWKAQFWTVSSPWCAIEGEPLHPEFEKNILALEPEKKSS